MSAEPSGSLAEDLLRQLPRSPDAYPQKLDLVSGTILLLQAGPALYAQASFLDDRILGPATQGAWVPLSQAAEAARIVGTARPLHFIFHTGHVGSTLVSRLLDETGDVLSLREPLPLRTLAEAHDVLSRPDSLLSSAQFDLILALFMRLWSRGYDQTRGVIVKATSSAGRLAVPILAASTSPRAIYLNLRAEPYLATLLGGQSSAVDLRGHASERFRRLQSHLAAALTPLHTLSIGELAALSWLTESWTQRDAVRRFPSRVLALDFDRFLSTVADGMGRVLRHFELPDGGGYLAGVDRSPVLTRYSKAPEHAYTPDFRARLLRDSRDRNREEIRKGMAWLEGHARSDGAVAELFKG